MPVQQVRFPDWGKLKLAPWQKRFLLSTSKCHLICAGRNAGKDWACVFWAVYHAFRLYNLRKQSGFDRLGYRVVVSIVGPTRNNYKGCWQKLRKVVPRLKGIDLETGEDNYSKDEKNKTIQLFGTAGIFFQMVTAYDGDNIVGDGWDITVITEGYHIKEATLHSAIFPMVNRATYAGLIAINSTPKGPDCWFDRACFGAGLENTVKEGFFGDWEAHHATSYDNVHNEQENIDGYDREKLANLPRWEQQRMAKLFVVVDDEADEEHPIKEVSLSNCYETENVPFDPTEPLLIGFDCGFLGPDPASLVVYSAANRWVHKIETFPKLTPEQNVDKMLKALEEYPNSRLIFDATGKGDPLQYAEGIKGNPRIKPIKFHPGNISQWGTDLLFRISKKTLRLPHPAYYPYRDDRQRSQFNEFYNQLRGWCMGTETFRGKERTRFFKKDQNDDIIQAFLLILSELPKPRSAYKYSAKNHISKIF